jgi:hypothetical protein
MHESECILVQIQCNNVVKKNTKLFSLITLIINPKTPLKEIR